MSQYSLSQDSKNKNVIIFDFDGVLADSFDYLYSLNRDGMGHIGLSFTKEQYRELFVGNVHQGFKDFINNDQKYLAFSEFRKANYDKYYYGEGKGVKLFSEAPTFIKKIGKKYILTIASSGKQENIKDLLKKGGVENSFDLILADSSHSKEGMIKEILNKYQATPGQAFFVTDTVGDIKEAKKHGLKTIAVTWGFHSKRRILEAHPDHVATDFNSLAEAIDKF
ncbi:MAG: hypothetical protein A3J47_03000 [Candidatus Yanofskybacteria bacterium RIFCSPHIGHO2_02_FULL_43_22]|uniref:FCP1 homology domain-containing protein n=1 Tax=Candidatus Yanofskybacteria bacterium RIFCSPHIGHO2_02_FULL_43_22 TaxID=1802681 RepID=A0A1F8FN13_9BACT|nr:MAG: hypothetical protein A3J47_03000 [Candidatus Yanofskybacteria bacterium RIFCSPHIGHO2_02_FULL_43_22]